MQKPKSATRTGPIVRKIQSAMKSLPQPVLRHGIFDPLSRMALRREAGDVAVWWPIAEAALGDDLVVIVDPRKLVGHLPKMLRLHGKVMDTRDWFIVPGAWDLQPVPLEKYVTHIVMAEMVAAQDYRMTRTYADLQAQKNSGSLPKRVVKAMEAFGGIDGYFERYSELARIMRESGEVPNFGKEDKDRFIGLAVGRDGQLLHSQKGHHRVALARLLPCPRMEAKVRAVHPSWLREQVKRTGLSPAKAVKAGVAGLAD